MAREKRFVMSKSKTQISYLPDVFERNGMVEIVFNSALTRVALNLNVAMKVTRDWSCYVVRNRGKRVTSRLISKDAYVLCAKALKQGVRSVKRTNQKTGQVVFSLAYG